jgi:hypothetical protein
MMIGLCGGRFAVHWACDIDGANLFGPKIVVRHKAEGFKAKKHMRLRNAPTGFFKYLPMQRL